MTRDSGATIDETRAPFRLSRRPDERVQVLGGTMDLVKAAEVFHFVKGRLAAGQKTLVANHNLHSLYLMRHDPGVRAFFDSADLTEVDSVPLILWARLIGGRGRRFHRCTYLDWREEFWDEAVRNGWRVFFLGGAHGVAEAARARILDRWPQAQLEIRHGHFDVSPTGADNTATLAAIEGYRPHILLVGMGMPRQELWLLDNYERLPTCAMFTVGGAFDYEAGVQAVCPRWIGQLGLEWLFRLCGNPRRLFFRYCIEPGHLIGPAFADVARALRRRARRKAA